MVRDIIKDIEFLSKKCENISDINTEKQLYTDLIETANAHKENCLGLAAPQIGELKRAICVRINDSFKIMINPLIFLRSRETYLATEGCLSIEGVRQVKRHHWVKVSYTQLNGKKVNQTFSAITAEIIQHEVDHLNGILI